jgi:outer membrane protein assembly factor BamD (BamD/ComL family)
MSTGTVQAFRQYLARPGGGQFSTEVRSILIQMDFGNAVNAAWQSGDAAPIRRFLTEFPDTPFAADARLQIEGIAYSRAQQANTPAAFRRFLYEYPSGQFAEQARGQIEIAAYNLAAQQNSSAAMRRFLTEYPSGQLVEQARYTLKILHDQGR